MKKSKKEESENQPNKYIISIFCKKINFEKILSFFNQIQLKIEFGVILNLKNKSKTISFKKQSIIN